MSKLDLHDDNDATFHFDDVADHVPPVKDGADFGEDVVAREEKGDKIKKKKKNKRQHKVVCKLADFGESRSVVVSATGRDNLGNPLWLAPEVIRSEVLHHLSFHCVSF